MGYTHYWDQTHAFTSDEWEKIRQATREITGICPVPLWYEFNDNRPYEIGPHLIRFNGPREEGHETFLLEREGYGFNLCKTGRKPYDIAVVAVLHAVSLIAPNACVMSSDGRSDDLQAGWNLALQASPWLLGLAIPVAVDDEAGSGVGSAG